MFVLSRVLLWTFLPFSVSLHSLGIYLLRVGSQPSQSAQFHFISFHFIPFLLPPLQPTS